MDKYKDNGIILGQLNLLNLPQEVVQMARKDLRTPLREIISTGQIEQ